MQMSLKRLRPHDSVPILIFLILAAIPVLALIRSEDYLLSLFERLMIFAIAALSLDFLCAFRVCDRCRVPAHQRRLFHHDHPCLRADGFLYGELACSLWRG